MNRSPPVDVVFTHSEVNNRYGTGILIQRMFPRHLEEVISVRATSIWGGQQEFGARQLVMPPGLDRARIRTWTLAQVGEVAVRHLYCVPFGGEEITAALAAHDAHGAPLCLYVMDDQNVTVDGIPDDVMEEAVEKARLRLAISSDMRGAYEAKYNRRFWIAPPTTSGDASPAPRANGHADRAILIGNIPTQAWLDALLAAASGSQLQIDWYSNSPGGGFWLRGDSLDALAAAGIALCDPLPERELAARLGEYEVAILPTKPQGRDDDIATASLSLPSRLTFLAGASDLAFVVLGDPDTCVARFVRHFGLGVNCEYSGPALDAAVASTRDEAWRGRQTRSLAWLRGVLGGVDVAAWIRDALVRGAPSDLAFEALEVEPRRVAPIRARAGATSARRWLG
jgi:hypothetical protein